MITMNKPKAASPMRIPVMFGAKGDGGGTYAELVTIAAGPRGPELEPA
jgi:hypothetical protein